MSDEQREQDIRQDVTDDDEEHLLLIRSLAGVKGMGNFDDVDLRFLLRLLDEARDRLQAAEARIRALEQQGRQHVILGPGQPTEEEMREAAKQFTASLRLEREKEKKQ